MQQTKRITRIINLNIDPLPFQIIPVYTEIYSQLLTQVKYDLNPSIGDVYSARNTSYHFQSS